MKRKGLLICMSVLAGLTLANAAYADDNGTNANQQAVNTTEVQTTNSSAILNDVANNGHGANINSSITAQQSVTGEVTATTQQARAGVPKYQYFDGKDATAYDFGTDGYHPHAYLYDESGYLVTTPGWHHYNNAFYHVFEPEPNDPYADVVKYGAWFYVFPNGQAATRWQQIDGNWYYFSYGKTGVGEMYEGGTYLAPASNNSYENVYATFDQNGHWIGSKPADPSDNNSSSGDNGWNESDGSWQYIQNGQAVTGWRQINGYWYYFNDDGNALTGLQKVNGHWYNFDSSNAYAITGWAQKDNNWYYFDPTNAWADDGWQQINGHWYYFQSDSDDVPSAVTGWQTINNHLYDFDSTNAWAVTGWAQKDNNWYYFDPTNAWADTGWFQSGAGYWYYFGNDGAALTGKQTINGHYYYFDANSSAALTGWQKVNNNWYYFDPTNAWADTGWFQSGAGNWYYFGNNGVADTGWQTINGHRYYFDPTNAWSVRGWQKLDGDWYYFDQANTWADTGWQWLGHWFYFDNQGKMQTGKHVLIDNKYSSFAANGYWLGYDQQ